MNLGDEDTRFIGAAAFDTSPHLGSLTFMRIFVYGHSVHYIASFALQEVVSCLPPRERNRRRTSIDVEISSVLARYLPCLSADNLRWLLSVLQRLGLKTKTRPR